MAAHAHEAPVAMHAPVPPPALAVKPEAAAESSVDAGGDDDAPAPEHDEQENGDVWDSASLYEEILDEVEAFEYSTDGECGLHCCTRCAN